MTAAAAVFCSVIAIALFDGFGSPAFATVIASDALRAAMPFLAALIVARFVASRFPARSVLVERVHASVQGLIAAMSFGWIWFEPHAMFTSLTGSSLIAMGWLAACGGLVGLVLARIAERAENSLVLRELSMGTWVFLLVGGGRIYRSFDHIEAGTRLSASIAILAGVFALSMALYMLFRRRPRLAAAVPALAPAVAALALFAASRSSSGPAAPTTRDSILVVVVDTLRADIADGRFAADPDAMPELRRMAEQGVRFTQAVSPAPWTLPATVSLLSGWNPHRHGFGATASDWEVVPGNPAALYLMPALRQAGYLTSAFLNNPYLRPWFGFGNGLYLMRPYHGRAVDGAALALDWLHGHISAPSFTLLHVMDPHWPYDAPPGFGAERLPCEACDSLFLAQFGGMDPVKRTEIAQRYAAEVRFTDAMLGRFYDTLSRGGALEHTWLIVTSDHGEEFWEHGGFLHGHSLYDELLRVPLVIIPPHARQDMKRGVRIDTQVRLEDVAATILEIAGIDTANAPDGKSLLGLIAQTSDMAMRDMATGDIAVRTSIAGYVKSPLDLSWSVRRPPWKAIGSPNMIENRLFDLVKDASEQHNLIFNPRMPADQLKAVSQTYFSLAAAPKKMGIPVHRERTTPRLTAPESDTKSQLKSLGYAH